MYISISICSYYFMYSWCEMTKQDLIDFEKMIADKWDAGLIKFPVHLSGGNEDELIQIFKNISKDDWVFSTHRSHYHYLLKASMTMNNDFDAMKKLDNMIMQGRSMHIMDKECNFFSSGIVAGCCAIAVGVAKAIKEEQKLHPDYDNKKVWCFIGDGATDEGHFYEAMYYSVMQELPITFLIEDNDRSVCTNAKQRCGQNETGMRIEVSDRYLKKYNYKPTYPHVGTGKTIKFADMGEVKETL